MEFFINNSTFVIAIIVFIICVVIGFFGDRRFKKNKKIKKQVENISNDNDKEDSLNDSRTNQENATSATESANDFNQNVLNNNENIYPTNPGVVGGNEPGTFSNPFVNSTNEKISDNFSKETNNAPSDVYPPENKPQNISQNTPEPFDGNVQIEENINNMF